MQDGCPLLCHRQSQRNGPHGHFVRPELACRRLRDRRIGLGDEANLSGQIVKGHVLVEDNDLDRISGIAVERGRFENAELILNRHSLLDEDSIIVNLDEGIRRIDVPSATVGFRFLERD
jgi:hypothetical protein